MKVSTTVRATAAALAIATALQPATAAGDVVLRRDGSKAVSVASPGPTSPYTTIPKAADGFDWGDAGLGAGAAALALALGAAGATSLRRRQTASGSRVSRPSPAVPS
jgi:hypothetical protein